MKERLKKTDRMVARGDLKKKEEERVVTIKKRGS